MQFLQQRDRVRGRLLALEPCASCSATGSFVQLLPRPRALVLSTTTCTLSTIPPSLQAVLPQMRQQKRRLLLLRVSYNSNSCTNPFDSHHCMPQDIFNEFIVWQVAALQSAAFVRKKSPTASNIKSRRNRRLMFGEANGVAVKTTSTAFALTPMKANSENTYPSLDDDDSTIVVDMKDASWSSLLLCKVWWMRRLLKHRPSQAASLQRVSCKRAQRKESGNAIALNRVDSL